MAAFFQSRIGHFDHNRVLSSLRDNFTVNVPMSRSGRRVPKGYNAFPSFAVTVDAVIDYGEVACRCCWCSAATIRYAGVGIARRIQAGRTLDGAAWRELHEEPGGAPKHLAQFGAYSDPGVTRTW